MVKKKKSFVKNIIKNKDDLQLFWVLVTIVVVIGVALGIYFYVQGLKTFEYAGVDWVIEKYEDMDFYHSRFKIMAWLPTYNAYFRTDPRENDVEIQEPIYFKFSKKTYISLKKELEECKGANVIANKVLGEFLSAGGVNVEGAVATPELAEEMNVTYANCNNFAGRNETVIVIEKSDYPYIWQMFDNCYIIRVGDCENVKAVEKFILANMIQLSEIEEFMQNQKE